MSISINGHQKMQGIASVFAVAALLCFWMAAPAIAEMKKNVKKENSASTSGSEKTQAVEKPQEKPLPPVTGIAMKYNYEADGNIILVPKETEDWREADFAGGGKVRVENGVVYLEKGNDMTGITWRGPLVRMNYEVTLEAMRVEGDDFFCGLTVPYNNENCSLIVGGWGGKLVGISSLDYEDAYNNETARFRDFETGKWYKIRLRITASRIEAWIDDKQIIDVETTDRKVGIRWEVTPTLPLGFSTWRTTGALRNIEIRAFDAPLEPEKPKEE